MMKHNTSKPAGKAKTSPATRTDRLRLGWRKATRPRSVGFADPQPASASEIKPTPILAHPDEGHLVTLGATGSGKTRGAMMPQALGYEGSMIINDPKGEIYAVSARARREMGHEIVVFDPYQMTDGRHRGGFNPFDLLKISSESLESFAGEIPGWLRGAHGLSLKSDPFWDNKADALIAACCAAVLAVKAEDERHLLSVRDMLHGNDTVYELAVLLDTKSKQLPPLAYQQIAAVLSTEEKCRSGILATVQERFTTFYHGGVEEALRKTTFDLAELRDGRPVTIYICIPPQKTAVSGRLLRLWIGGLLSLMFTRRCRPSLPTLFMLDEAASIGELEEFRTLLTLTRSYGVRCWSFWQDASQITRLYKEDWPTILNNLEALQIFSTPTHLAAKAAVQLVGECVQAQDLLRMPADEQLLLTTGGEVTRCTKLDYLNDAIFADSFDKNPMYAGRDGNGECGRSTR